MTKFKNKAKDNFLRSLPTISVYDEDGKIGRKARFNFAYFDKNQQHSSCFTVLSENKKNEIYLKLIEYSKETLDHWKRTGIGKNRKSILEVYGSFPNPSGFTHPAHVPHDVLWARFRLDQNVRLIGFVCPSPKPEVAEKHILDSGTFYIVFIDLEHNFYSFKRR